jgi:hypothetical protein
MPVKALLIASLVVVVFFCGSLTLATNVKSTPFHNGCNRGAGALANPTKCASSLDQDEDPDQRNPMKWTGATKSPSLCTNFETNANVRNTVCGRVVMMEGKNNVFKCIGTKKINNMGNSNANNPRAATNKASNEVTPTALQQQNGVKSINLPVKLFNKVSTLTGTIETSALAVKSNPRPRDYYDLDLKMKKEAGRTKKTRGAMEVRQSSDKRKACVLQSIFRLWGECFKNLKRSSRTPPGNSMMCDFLSLTLCP